jgi:hypothetical protein
MTQLLAATRTTSSDVPAGFWVAMVAIWAFFLLVWAVPSIIGFWKVLQKTDRPGWGAIVPIYNNWLIIEIVGRPGWWLALLFIPYASIVFMFILMIDLAKSFGKGTGFGVGLILLAPVFWLMLGFGDATYLGPSVPQPGIGTGPVPLGGPPAGWYPDPWQQAPHRWWDGTAWTSHTG